MKNKNNYFESTQSPFDSQETLKLLKSGRKEFEPSWFYYLRKKLFTIKRSIADSAEIWFYEKWLIKDSPKPIPIRGRDKQINYVWTLLYQNWIVSERFNHSIHVTMKHK